VPMIGGMISSTLLTLVVIPAIFALVKASGLARHDGDLGRSASDAADVAKAA